VTVTNAASERAGGVAQLQTTVLFAAITTSSIDPNAARRSLRHDRGSRRDRCRRSVGNSLRITKRISPERDILIAIFGRRGAADRLKSSE